MGTRESTVGAMAEGTGDEAVGGGEDEAMGRKPKVGWFTGPRPEGSAEVKAMWATWEVLEDDSAQDIQTKWVAAKRRWRGSRRRS